MSEKDAMREEAVKAFKKYIGKDDSVRDSVEGLPELLRELAERFFVSGYIIGLNVAAIRRERIIMEALERKK